MDVPCIRFSDLFGADKNIYTHIIPYENSKPHRHDFIEFFYVFDGSSMHIVNEHKSRITIGDAFVLLPQDVHCFVPTKDAFLHRDILLKLDCFQKLCDYFSPTLFSDILEKKYDLQFSVTSTQIAEIENFIATLLNADSAKEQLITNFLYGYILNLIIERNLHKDSGYPTWLTRLLSMLNAPENLSVELGRIVEMFSYSKEYMCRSFKKHIGMTMTDYFNMQKLKYAYSMLQATDYTVESICKMLNFSNVSYFYRLFKQHFHTTPHSVKKEGAENDDPIPN